MRQVKNKQNSKINFSSLKKTVLAVSLSSAFLSAHSQSIITTGDTNLSYSGNSPWNIDSDLIIGNSVGSNGAVVVDGGYLSINQQYGYIFLGQDAGSTGNLEIKNNGQVRSFNALIGRNGTGNLLISSGGQLYLTNNLLVGKPDTFLAGIGYIKVSDKNSYLEASDISFGSGDWQSTSYVTIENGGRVKTRSFNSFQNGTMTIDGVGSKLEVSGEFSVGGTNLAGNQGNQGTVVNPVITISNGGSLSTGSALIGKKTHGYPWISSTTFNINDTGSTWVNSGDIILGDGLQNNKTLLNIDGGTVQTNTLTFGATAVEAPGTASDASNTLEVKGGGTLTTKQILNNSPNSNNFIIFDGGNLKAAASNPDFISGFSNLILKSGGITLDTQNFDISVSANMSLDGLGATSTGSLIKKGTGSLTLSGTNNYSGGTTVENGLLIPSSNTSLGSGLVSIEGNATSAAMVVGENIDLPNEVSVLGNGLLYGAGAVGNTTVNTGGTIQAGMDANDIGILTIDGNLDINGGTYKAVLSEDGSYQSDLLKVTGTATLNNATLYHSGVWDGYQLGEYFTVLEAGTLNTKFTTVDGDYAFVDVIDDYSIANTVRIGLFRNSEKFENLALTPNQKSTAQALDKMDLGGQLDDYVATLPKDYVTNAFDLLSGEIHATLRSSLLSWSDSTSQSSLGQLRSSMQYCAEIKTPQSTEESSQKTQDCAPRKNTFDGWAQVIGNWNQISSDGNAAKSKSNTGGLLLGTDYGLSDSGWRIGGVFGYGKSTVKSNARRSSADLQNYTLGVHAGKRFNWGSSNYVNVMGGLSYTHHSIKTDRLIPRISQTLTSKYSGNTVQAFGEVGYAMAPIGQWKLEPFVGLNVSKQKVGSFEETGGYAGVHSKAESKTYTTAMFGVHAQSNLDISGKPMQVRGTLGLKQALGNKEVTRTMAFNQGSPDYLIWGVPRSSSTLVLGLQAQMSLSPNATLEAGFSGEFGKKVREQAIQARVRWAF